MILGSFRKNVSAGVAGALLLVAAGCGSGGGSSPSQPTITLYSAQHAQTTNALVTAFTKATGVRVRVDSNDEDVLTAQLEQEGSRSPADLFYTENSNWLVQLDQKGMLAPVEAAALANVPASDSATDGDWVGVSARVAALVYDPSKISASHLPTSVMQLAQPQWKGKIELAPAETDFWPVICSVEATYGKAAAVNWLKGLKNNAGSEDNVPDNETLTSDINQGVRDLAIINHYYWYRLRAEDGGKIRAQLAYFAPHDPGYVESVSGIAVLKSSKHQAAAQQFVDFVTSSQGQQVLAQSDSYEYPLHPGVAPSGGETPLSQLQPNSFTPAQLGTGLQAKTLLQDAGLL